MFNAIELRRVDLNLLVVFEAVFLERSVKRAAERLFLGQSAVSMALSRLRDLFHDELFVKVAAGVAPTSKAIAIEPQVRQALELAHNAVYEVTEFEPASAVRVIRLALSDDLGFWLFPAVFDELQRIAPGVTVVIRESNWYTGVGLVERGEADVACGILPDPGSSLLSERLYQERFVSLFDSAHVKPPLSMDRFLGTAHVLMSIAGDFSGLIDEALRATGKQRRVVATTPGFVALGALVKGRHLIASLPEVAATALARSFGLSLAEPPVALGKFPVSMVWHARTDRDSGLRWFRDRVREVVRRFTPADDPDARMHRRKRRRRRVS